MTASRVPFLEAQIVNILQNIVIYRDSSNEENSDNTYESSTGGEASADYSIRGADEDRTTSSSTTTTEGGGITDKIKEKIKGAKGKVVSTADTAADTTKKVSLLLLQLLTNK